jgi:hypothetical protein
MNLILNFATKICDNKKHFGEEGNDVSLEHGSMYRRKSCYGGLLELRSSKLVS